MLVAVHTIGDWLEVGPTLGFGRHSRPAAGLHIAGAAQCGTLLLVDVPVVGIWADAA